MFQGYINIKCDCSKSIKYPYLQFVEECLKTKDLNHESDENEDNDEDNDSNSQSESDNENKT